ncbi:DUF2778 domain-containing protein [Phyllobacterium leguminum]|uniref:DUF2778 domain-containing protein n=1 Tax=Phyllobacterium leguminum TaxID=314237 RepID=UPI00315DC512
MRKVVRCQSLPHSLGRVVRPLLIASGSAAFAGATLWSVIGMMAVSNPITGSSHYLPKPQLSSVKKMRTQPLDQQARGSMAKKLLAEAETAIAMMNPVVDDEKTGRPIKQADSMRMAGAPALDRFGSRSMAHPDKPQILLAYAGRPSNSAARAALSALLAPSGKDSPSATEATDDLEQAEAELPDNIPLPQLRPLGEIRKPALEGAKALARAAVPPASGDEDRETAKPQLIAYARPNAPQKGSGGLGQTFRDLFGNRPKAGNGIAVYDISAAKVYMPDGSVLEAHSGIGKMADNPRYAHVKMNGPTPPHTYNLRMRESRFHGVEAIRMLPVDGKNKYGRDGFLTHSYLLRGGREESHGCVAFEDYDRFLNAFKQGKVKQMIVVPGRGEATMRLVSNGGRV